MPVAGEGHNFGGLGHGCCKRSVGYVYKERLLYAVKSSDEDGVSCSSLAGGETRKGGRVIYRRESWYCSGGILLSGNCNNSNSDKSGTAQQRVNKARESLRVVKSWERFALQDEMSQGTFRGAY
jgi:hypothetical protein